MIRKYLPSIVFIVVLAIAIWVVHAPVWVAIAVSAASALAVVGIQAWASRGGPR
ncbi:hypothetical protein [Streptomyces rubiginosohelvolus]|uniref:hypothetical protein n=1 Tax=Streptomyces rubiginosohelvolus TaxID=67362 RepID=UPI0033DB6820